MVARSAKRSNQRPDTLMQDRSPPVRRNPLATHGRTIHWVKPGPVPGLRNVRSALCRHRPRVGRPSEFSFHEWLPVCWLVLDRPALWHLDAARGPSTPVAVGTRVSWHAPRTEPYGRLSRIRLVWGFLCQGGITPFLSCCCFILLFDPRREHSSVPTAYFHRRRAQRRSRTALLQRRRRLVLDGREHGGRLPVIGWLAAR